MKKQYFILLLFFPIILKAQINSNLEIRKISEIELKDSYLSKPIVLSNGEYMMFVSSKKSEKGITESQIHLAHFDNNQWGIIPANIPLSEKYNNVPIGALKEKLGFYIFSIPKPGEKGESVINVLAFLNNEWVIERKIQIPEFFPEKKGFDLFMSSGENVILFSFYGENTYGSEDIYAMVKESDGSWSNLINLGLAINTKGSEVTPFYDEESKMLVYATNNSSNNQYDVFYCKRLDNSWTNWSAPVNFGIEINSDLNESGFYFSNKTGYLISNKSSLFNNIYTIKGISIFNIDKPKNTETTVLLEKNKYSEECEAKTKMLEKQIEILKFQYDSINKTTSQKTQFIDVTDQQKNVFSSLSILFGFNSYVLSPDAQILLNNIANHLTNNTNLCLKISGYCDTKGSPKYNQKLSEQRANAVKNYFMNKGIDKNRLRIIGMGKATTNNSQVSDKDMEYYRRVDLVFEVIKY